MAYLTDGSTDQVRSNLLPKDLGDHVLSLSLCQVRLCNEAVCRCLVFSSDSHIDRLTIPDRRQRVVSLHSTARMVSRSPRSAEYCLTKINQQCRICAAQMDCSKHGSETLGLADLDSQSMCAMSSAASSRCSSNPSAKLIQSYH